MADHILRAAAKLHASDVYIEACETGRYRLRIRVGGALKTAKWLSQSDYLALITRFKTLSCMDIGNRLILQDGAFVFTAEDGRNTVNVRASCVPTADGEHLALRLFDKRLYTREFSALGMATEDVKKVNALLSRENGLLLVTGPTGAGKSSTCYAMLNRLNRENRHIVTLEDPVEVHLPGVTQIKINEKQHITFGTGLRAALRQDPDVIFIGEIRDGAAANAAMQAALTGHLVISTLHTKDVRSTVKRLARFGIDAADTREALIGVISQRLMQLGRKRTGVFEICDDFRRAFPDPRYMANVAERKSRYEASDYAKKLI